MILKIAFAVLVVAIGGGLAFCSAIFGALLLTSANGPTRENWIGHYVFTFCVPLAVLLVCAFVLSWLFR